MRITPYKKKLGFALTVLSVAIGLAFTFYPEKFSTSKNYPDIIAITLPFEINTLSRNADFLSNKEINEYSGVIPSNIQEIMNRMDFNPDEIEPGIIKAKVDTDSVNALGEMIKNNQLTLHDLYEDISPVFGEAVRNNEINWDWNGYTMEYTFYVAEGDELFWKIYFSHPLETLFFHEAFLDVDFIQKDILTNITQNIIHDEENEVEYNVLNKTEKFTSLAQKTTNFYADTILNIVEKYNTPFREDNLQMQFSSMLGVNGETNLNIKNNIPEKSTDLKVNLDGNILNEEISADANIRKIQNDIFAILNTYEYSGEFDGTENLKNIINQWYQLNNPDISEILTLLLNEKIQADLLTIGKDILILGKDILILAKDIILTTDIFIVDEYLGVNEESGYEEFSITINEKYISYVENIFHISFSEMDKEILASKIIISFDTNNPKYLMLEIGGFPKNETVAFSITPSFIYLHYPIYNFDIKERIELRITNKRFTVLRRQYEAGGILNRGKNLIEIGLDENNLQGFVTQYQSIQDIAQFKFIKNELTNEWSGEITSNLSDLETVKVIIENFIFEKQTFSGVIKLLKSENILGKITLDFSTSYPKNLEIENPAENEENTIKSFEEFNDDINKKHYDTPPITPGHITLPTNPENYAGSFHKGNYVWGGAMNLTWTDLREKIIQEEITLDLKTSETEAQSTVNKLNNPVLTTEDLSEKNYYIKSGYGQETIDAINKESKEKFPSKSFDDLDIKLSPKDIIAYAYFLKEIEYTIPFTISKYPFFFKDGSTEVQSFYAENEEQKENISILNYENDEKFIVSLSLKDRKDNLILAKGYDMNTPEEVVKHMHKILQHQEIFETLHKDDSFQMPFLHVDMTRTYTELINKYFTNINFEKYFIAQMFENIKFDMNEKGARVENEAVIIGITKSIAIDETNKYIPKRIILDDDFWVIMKQNNSLNPYFLLGVQNEGIMKPFEEK